VEAVGKELPKQIADAYRGLTTTNRLKGIVVDLRYATGDDYAAAAATADRFLSTELSMIDYGEGVVRSTVKTNSVVLPVAILVNGETARAAEALAGILRHTEVGLLLGATTAGQASTFKDFTLKNGTRVRIAVAPVKVGEGVALPLTGLVPDIQVGVSADEGVAYYKDPYATVARSTLAGIDLEGSAVITNRVPRRRLNEAELVRMMREGISPDAESPVGPVRENAAARPIIRDPVLARAIDLLKGLAVVQQFRTI
jgi:C-terminal processing protease CtpA/Prc